ncbi:MAG: murein L,D-transpeptidase catalytic domain family protein [Bdellovibrionota bacterium]
MKTALHALCTVFVLISSSMAFASIADRKINYKGKNTSLKEAVLAQGVPSRPLELAFQFFDANENNFDNHNYMTVIDFRTHSAKERFFLINLNTGAVEAQMVSHGKGSDPGHDGIAERFSNIASSNMSSLGFYQVSETYNGKHGYSVKLDGLSPTNSKARSRAIVIHGATYVKRGLAKQGRSFGCPALDQNLSKGIINKIKEGSLLFIYAPAFEFLGLEQY